jgi:hypothetical protein
VESTPWLGFCGSASSRRSPKRAAPVQPGPKKTDIVLLRNGGRITGEERDLERGNVTVKTDDTGTLTIEWEKVLR